jgi:hypothetical protein
MDILHNVYCPNVSLFHVVMGLLIFGGLARIAFWRDVDGMRVGGPLAVGLAMLLTVALLLWAEENHRRIQEIGPWAALILIEAILLLAVNARRKAKRM